MYENLVAWLRTQDFEPICPCCSESICEGKDCAILQAADAIEELQGRAKVLEKIADKWCEGNRRFKMRDKLPEIPEDDLFPELTAEEKARNKRIAKDYPCDTCRWSPPSAFDGKPCCACDPYDPMLNCYEKKEANDGN